MTKVLDQASDVGFRSSRWRTCVLLAFLSGPLSLAEALAADRMPVDDEAAVRLARQYLASEDDREREKCLARLESFTGNIENVLQTLRTRTYPPVNPGYYPELKFESAKRRRTRIVRDACCPRRG